MKECAEDAIARQAIESYLAAGKTVLVASAHRAAICSRVDGVTHVRVLEPAVWQGETVAGVWIDEVPDVP